VVLTSVHMLCGIGSFTAAKNKHLVKERAPRDLLSGVSFQQSEYEVHKF